AGLFSAVITAFINQSMTNMKPDPAAQAVAALQTISLQLKVLSDAVTVNILWILSLVTSVICALCALLVQSWTRSYLAKMATILDPHLRSKTRLFLRRALKKYSASGFVSAVTALLHASVFLFLGGLM
ncbi:hypothetical protein BDN72DRAFT_749194, partial [Pluteus cervinus]